MDSGEKKQILNFLFRLICPYLKGSFKCVLDKTSDNMGKDIADGFYITCKRCNRPFAVYPPSSEYITILQKDCERGQCEKRA